MNRARAALLALGVAAIPGAALAQPAAVPTPAPPAAAPAPPGNAPGAGRAPGGVEPLPAASRPTLDLTVEAPEGGASTGDLLTLRLTATTAAAGDDVSVPAQDLAPFEVLAKRVARTPLDDGRVRFVFELDLLALAPGPAVVGPLELRVVTGDGRLGRVETDAVDVEIASVLGNEPNAEPKPPTEPVSVVEPDHTLLWLLGALGVAAIAAIATLLVSRWWSRREARRAPPPPPRPAWDIAREELAFLRRDRTRAVEEGRGDAWADRLSDVVRAYLGARCGFDGLESTTDEVIARVERRRPRGLRMTDVVQLLGDLDLVKFAKADLDDAHGAELLDAAEALVATTAPTAAPPSSAAGTSPPPPTREAHP